MAKSTENERLEQVHAILTSPNRIRSIQAVAVDHGFDDLAEFNRLFKQRFGTSPVAVRDFAKKPGRR